MKKDIIFYSNYCTYSKEIINQISKTPINDNIIYVSVDDENIELPPFVKAVPTIYLVNEKKIVVDEGISQWIKEKVSKPKDDTITPFFGSTDSSFSSGFSMLDNSTEKPFVSSFTFLGDEQKIETPNADNKTPKAPSTSVNNSNNFSYSSAPKNEFEALQEQRNSEFNPIQRM